jgi:hypothetical protein
MRFSLVRLIHNPAEQESMECVSKEFDEARSKTIMCWTPPDAKVGDTVCMIHGLRIPMVVREEQGHPDRPVSIRWTMLCPWLHVRRGVF